MVPSYGYMITWPGRRTLMDRVPRGRIQHVLTHRGQHPLARSFDGVPVFNYDGIFSFLIIIMIFFSLFPRCYFHFMFTTSGPRGPDNIICYSARPGCYIRYTCVYNNAASSLEDFFPGRRKNPKINWFCLRYSSLCTGRKKKWHIIIK